MSSVASFAKGRWLFASGFNRMRAGWNPARRNRHAGTAAHGHGADNDLRIPGSRHRGGSFHEQLGRFVPVRRSPGGREIVFLVQATGPGYHHPCGIDDICAVLSACPAADLAALDLVVLRQPTRKQRILNPVWGRALAWFETPGHSGSAIVLEAMDGKPYRWGRSLSVEDSRELERLREDGREIHATRRGFEIRPSAPSLRHTVLYRTLLHELGHLVDRRDRTEQAWSSRAARAKEDFAHRYARERLAALRLDGVVPFAAGVDHDRLALEGLRIEWFAPASADDADWATE